MTCILIGSVAIDRAIALGEYGCSRLIAFCLDANRVVPVRRNTFESFGMRSCQARIAVADVDIVTGWIDDKALLRTE